MLIEEKFKKGKYFLFILYHQVLDADVQNTSTFRSQREINYFKQLIQHTHSHRNRKRKIYEIMKKIKK